MKLTISEVEKIAQLARIELTKDEKQKFAEDLSAILEYVGKLQEVDTAQIEPTAQVTGLVNVMREDKVKACPGRAEILAQAPDIEAGGLKVKSVF